MLDDFEAQRERLEEERKRQQAQMQQRLEVIPSLHLVLDSLQPPSKTRKTRRVLLHF